MTRYLLIDVGNTRTKWAETTARGTIQVCSHLPTEKIARIKLAKKFSNHRMVIASVVPKVTQMLRRSFSDAIFVHGALRGLPLAFAYPRPVEIGADRIAAAAAAKGRGAAIVVSCGTATAFSVVDSRGRFCGGAIAPGPEAQMRALIGATAQLPATKARSVKHALGKSTREAMQAGVTIGYVGGVREIVEQLRKELGEPARVIVTGGAAEHLRGVRGLGRVEFRPLLVFEGLRIIADAFFET